MMERNLKENVHVEKTIARAENVQICHSLRCTCKQIDMSTTNIALSGHTNLSFTQM